MEFSIGMEYLLANYAVARTVLPVTTTSANLRQFEFPNINTHVMIMTSFQVHRRSGKHTVARGNCDGSPWSCLSLNSASRPLQIRLLCSPTQGNTVIKEHLAMFALLV